MSSETASIERNTSLVIRISQVMEQDPDTKDDGLGTGQAVANNLEEGQANGRKVIVVALSHYIQTWCVFSWVTVGFTCPGLQPRGSRKTDSDHGSEL